MTSISAFPPLHRSCSLTLLPVALPNTDGFITDVSLFSPVGQPETLLLTAQFDLSCFDERLYASCQLPSPDHLKRAVRKRRAEYFASRVVVRYALARLGVEGVILSNDADRAPVWPAGVSGSLSHSHQRIALLLSRSGNRLLSGVDCEQVMRPETAEEMQSMIVTSEENQKLLESGVPFATALTLAFSVKESLYKALFPPLRQYMDFSAAEITALFSATGKVQLRLTTSFSSDFPAGREFTGQVELEGDQVLSWVIEETVPASQQR